ncbi:hypothetical protein UU7_07561 [Rhodanobacter spathiphylli B39]|uniref:Uncharacterized protein n=1 Tax=Rhodanobacter spathiphylli B39 TaxID=1163407 RepID=I4W2J1_9GAMM|nr:hypothetical protein UU7_07561 [Rhodanobacter spathiphylli B39]
MIFIDEDVQKTIILVAQKQLYAEPVLVAEVLGFIDYNGVEAFFENIGRQCQRVRHLHVKAMLVACAWISLHGLLEDVAPLLLRLSDSTIAKLMVALGLNQWITLQSNRERVSEWAVVAKQQNA